MQVTRNVIVISDVFRRMKDGSLKVNKKYQRSAKLWPNTARSYFIDTILEGYPFPKITLRQIINSTDKSAIQEIVDGQQRVGTIVDFLNNELRLSSTSKNYAGLIYDELDEDAKEKFLSYEISVDTITRATDEEVLEVFRRMNAYMLPLNKSELRYSQYQGKFKWFISNLAEKYMPFFQESRILSLKEISRMKDSELITECTQVILSGIENHSDSALEKLYKDNDIEFKLEKMCLRQITETFDYIKDNFYKLYSDGNLTSYMFYSLFSALQYNRFGYAENDRDEQITPQGFYCKDPIVASENIAEMLSEVEQRRDQRRNHEPVDNTTRFAAFAQACESSTHRKKQRKDRRHYLLLALQQEHN